MLSIFVEHLRCNYNDYIIKLKIYDYYNENNKIDLLHVLNETSTRPFEWALQQYWLLDFVVSIILLCCEQIIIYDLLSLKKYIFIFCFAVVNKNKKIIIKIQYLFSICRVLVCMALYCG